MADRYFNREEAEELLPMIGRSLERAQEQKKSIEPLERDLAMAAARIMMAGGSQPPYQELVKKKNERDKVMARIEEIIKTIQETGCVVKDFEEGLVDFPALVGGEEVYLCWKQGEERIGFWHGIDEGFAGRKPLKGEDDADEPRNPRMH
ncbi:MAG TPA: DUF2203 domain-containing protein [Terriglobia bacterium]|nr:DUF2203 domain-containing protein [Terriglobia bacterium]